MEIHKNKSFLIDFSIIALDDPACDWMQTSRN